MTEGGTGCLNCGGTGILPNGKPCNCGITDTVVFPFTMKVPLQYQGVRFKKELLPVDLRHTYGQYMENLAQSIVRDIGVFHKNLLICAPPNSGKTVFAYYVCGLLFAKGIRVLELRDIIEVRDILKAEYKVDWEQRELYSTVPFVVIKIPQDLPNHVWDTVSMVIERRVRSGGFTVFLYSGAKEDLYNQDTFGKLRALEGDGSYNSLKVESWVKRHD